MRKRKPTTETLNLNGLTMSFPITSTDKPEAYVCIVRNYWGRGKSAEEAKKNCKNAGGDMRGKRVIYKVEGDAEPYVTDWGALSYRKGSTVTTVDKA